MKELLKKIIPNVILADLTSLHQKQLLKHAAERDLKNYMGSAIISEKQMSPENIKSSLIFFTHSIEKGLSHPDFRPNFGKKALHELSKNIYRFNAKKLNKSSFEYQNSISVLKAYKMRHRSLSIDTPYFDSLFNNSEYEEAKEIAGEHQVEYHRNMSTFDSFARSRNSVREFAQTNVDVETLKQCIKTAILTPSVCNRQPWHVTLIREKKNIDELLTVQGGFKGYPTPPMLSILSVDLEDFRGPFERNEPFIDGGLFLMNYLYALTDAGLVSCTLNTMLDTDSIQAIKKIAQIPDTEVLISFVVIGNPKKRYHIANSARKDVEDVLRFKDSL